MRISPDAAAHHGSLLLFSVSQETGCSLRALAVLVMIDDRKASGIACCCPANTARHGRLLLCTAAMRIMEVRAAYAEEDFEWEQLRRWVPLMHVQALCQKSLMGQHHHCTPTPQQMSGFGLSHNLQCSCLWTCAGPQAFLL